MDPSSFTQQSGDQEKLKGSSFFLPTPHCFCMCLSYRKTLSVWVHLLDSHANE